VLSKKKTWTDSKKGPSGLNGERQKTGGITSASFCMIDKAETPGSSGN
jgi:hypothetical protein